MKFATMFVFSAFLFLSVIFVIPKDADISPLAPLVLQKLRVSDSSQESIRFLKSRESHKSGGKIYDFHYSSDSFVSAEKKFDVSVRVVENIEEESVSIEKETITPQKIVTGLVSLSFKDKNNILLIVVILIIALIVYIIIRRKKEKRKNKQNE